MIVGTGSSAAAALGATSGHLRGRPGHQVGPV